MNTMGPFDINTPKELVSNRYDMIQAKEKDEKISHILTKFGISRPIFYKFYHRYQEFGLQGLYNLSKAPHNHGLKTSAKEEARIISLFHAHPYFSSYELNELTRLNPRTIQRIYKRNNLIKIYKPKSEKKTILEKLKKEILRERIEGKSKKKF